ncbi:hypothetical protein EF847_01520 [Actinobacteria bacterium YIM 96077]|uniref:Uncharacterized protein n=1 Tax=Phytoactinopolyspora halophila TaxID=1981511 RepID=A0A329QFZ8_9ACTN|nr:hypothetical protein EF847_01520 [Actinobacteria bacterium YIM 96077]RAW11146.1 hypothetical protein DPM12_17545 [Phytoactinopolyspora halophila]
MTLLGIDERGRPAIVGVEDVVYVDEAGYFCQVSHEEIVDFQPDPLLTEEAAKKIRAEERERIADLVERDITRRAGVLLDASGCARLARWLREGAR